MWLTNHKICSVGWALDLYTFTVMWGMTLMGIIMAFNRDPLAILCFCISVYLFKSHKSRQALKSEKSQ